MAFVTQTTTTISTTTTIIDDAQWSILGDDFAPNICRPYTYTVVSISASRLDAVTTVTQTDVISFTTGTTATVTVPTPAGFLPIQDTVPGATYARRLSGANPIDGSGNANGTTPTNRRMCRVLPMPARARRRLSDLDKQFPNGSCKATTVTHRTTDTILLVTTSSITLTGSVVLCPYEGTYYQWSEVATFFSTTTELSATPSYATTSTVTISTSTTVATSSVEVYAACATDNFADAIITTNGSVVPVRYTEITGVFNIPVTSAYECCVRTFTEAGGITWLWSGLHNVCYFSYPGNGSCDPKRNITVYYGGDGDDEGPDDERVVGNAFCGSATAATYGPLRTLSYPFDF